MIVQSDKVEKLSIRFSKMLKVPVLRIGRFSDSERTYEYTQQDFDSILRNFNTMALGWMPPFWIGHPIDGFSFSDSGDLINPYATMGGAPRSGYVVKLYQEGEYLMSEVCCVDEKTYNAVVDKKYGYSSAEIIRNFKSPTTGEDLGTTLWALALTNTPFIPGLPSPEPIQEQHSSIYSEYCSAENKPELNTTVEETRSPNVHTFVIPLDIDTKEPGPTVSEIQPNQQPEKETMTDNKDIQLLQEQVETLTQKLNDLSTSLAKTESDKVELLSQLSSLESSLKAEKENSKEQYTTFATQLQKLSSDYEAAKAQLAEYKLQERIKEVERLSVEKSIKDQYCDSLRNGKLIPGSEEDLYRFEFLTSLSIANKENLTSQRGDATAASVQEVNPFERIIQRNKELSTKKK